MSKEISREGNNRSLRKRNLAFYAITISLSFLLSLLIIEIALRNISYTSDVNVGNAAFYRWVAKHWRVNELGYRDILVAPRLSSSRPKLYFLGDSFTAGVGVEFKDTYYFKTGLQLQDDYNLFNISRLGLSTPDEHNELDNFNKSINSRPDIVVHQYFINDIDNHISKPAWEPPGWLSPLDRHLESLQLLESYFINKEWIRNYKSALIAAYRSPDILRRHKSDLLALHQSIRADGGVVIFLVFPALSDRDRSSLSFVVNEMREFFSTTCRPNDIFIDATPAALSLEESKRVVSFLDHHPSPALHSLIAAEIINAIRRGSTKDEGDQAYETCESLKTSLTRRPEAQK